MLLCYDVAIQALSYDLGLLVSVDHTVLAFIQADVLAYFGIVILILWKQGSEAAPAA